MRPQFQFAFMAMAVEDSENGNEECSQAASRQNPSGHNPSAFLRARRRESRIGEKLLMPELPQLRSGEVQLRPPKKRFSFSANSMFASARGVLGGFLFGMLVLCPAIARAQDAPSGAVGQVEGKDISVDGGTAARGGTATAPSIYVSNGSVVTVHAGKARMILFAGGEVEICGPAKFTVLLSGNAITLALNFGRLRVELPAETTLRVFTPTIIGTPIDISGGLRDVTVGLNLDDLLC